MNAPVIPPPIHVAVYLAVPPDETIAPDDETRAATIVHDALAWWSAHTPKQPTFTVDALRVVSMPRPGSDGWLQDIPVHPPDGVAVWLYVNHDPFYLIPGNGRDVIGTVYGSNALVVLDPRQLPWTPQSTVAHELGHILYNLPDWYRTDPTCTRGMDLMCNAEAAYVHGWLGCRSLAWIGSPCKTTYLPLTQKLQHIYD